MSWTYFQVSLAIVSHGVFLQRKDSSSGPQDLAAMGSCGNSFPYHSLTVPITQSVHVSISEL